MCTLIALHRKVPGACLLVGANRDEFHARPAEGPALRKPTPGRASFGVLAPLDVEAGGTWLGLSDRGVFAAVTNVSGAEPDPERRSRGLLVMDVLAARDAREAMEKLSGLPIGAYNAFNLFVADARDALALTYRDAPQAVPVEDGVAVVGNAPLDGPVPGKLAGLRERVLAVAAPGGDAVLDGLAGLCRDHSEGERGPLDALCVHTPAYGTRSSTLLRLADGGLLDSHSVFRFADGAPCETEYEDYSPLLRDLGNGGQASKETSQ